ncbi:peptidoglycan-recognition protein LE-like [Thrips palmi]|uniref:Peptidoglycan-recognition protein LE-like n=1 Tax=Thrips palmi TaxID=161013 RepID=A0A6P9AB26_THRPL|nr:peptidoglycan-recognition protein LE-like [Thrips palmi]
MHVPDTGTAGAGVAAASKLYADCSPALCRSVSAVDSGYNDRDFDDDGASSVFSDSSCSIVSEAKDLVHRANDNAATVAFEGNIVVENSTQVQFGNNTHYHGPVTVLLNSNKCITNGSVAPATPEILSSAMQDAALPAQRAPEPASPPTANADVPPKAAAKQGPGRVLSLLSLSRRRCVALTAATSATLVVVVLLCVLLPAGKLGGPKIAPVALPNGLTLVQRHEWLAQPAKPGVDPVTASPVQYVILHHSATDTCYSFPECVLRIRYLQTFHMESKNWSDIAYNFLVGGDGYVYVGRGWDKAGAHTLNWNHRSVGISLVGTFSYQKPTMEQMRAVFKLIGYGVELNKVVPDYKLAAVCQFRSTESPGKFVLDEMRKSDHWWNYTVGDSYCK